MFQVVCVNVGQKFEPEYVHRLQRAVALNLKLPHDFAVVTDAPQKYHCRTLPAMDNLKGYWQKVTLFAPEREEQYRGNRILYLDLDTVVMGDISELLTHPATFIALKDQLLPMINSSVMCWNFDEFRHVYANFNPDEIPEWTRGDQEYTNSQVWATYAQELFGEAQYPDFKENLKHREPISGEKLVWFHGVPHPHTLQWVQDLWRKQKIEYQQRTGK